MECRPVAGAVVLLACASSIVSRPPAQQALGNAVIAGVVVDERQAPVARARVLVFPAADARAASDASHQLPRSAGSASTDDTGSFRISDLAAGDYVVAAEAMPAFPNGGPVPARVWGPTFYPSTLDVSQAAPVRALDAGSTPLRIELVAVTPVRVSGTVTTASGRSAQGFDVRLFRSFGGFGTGSTVATVGAKGTFEIPRVPPGAYGLIVEPHASQPGQQGREFVERTLQVRERDLDLPLTATAGASLSGRVVAEPYAIIPSPIGLRVTADPDHAVGQVEPGRFVAAAVTADWSFTMTGLAGRYDFLASSDRPPPVIATRVVVDGTSYAGGKGIALGDGHHDVAVFVALREEAPKAAGAATLTAAQLSEQFRNEKVFWKQMEIGKAIVDRRDASVLPALAVLLQHPDRHVRGNTAFIFARFGDPNGLQTIEGILADRSARPEGQGIPDASGDGRYHFARQVAADRYYAAHLLGDVQDPRGVDLLVPLLDDRETQSVVPWSLGEIGDRRAIRPLIAALDKDDPSLRVLVIYALETLHAREAVPRLRGLLSDHRTSRLGTPVAVSEAAKAAIARLQEK